MSTSIKHAAEIQIVSRIDNNYKLKCTAYVIKQVTEILPVKKLNNENWLQLHGLPLADPTYNNPGKIDLLLGVNVYTDILMNGVIKGKPGSPLAQQTALGWIISGGAPVEEFGKNGKIVSMHLSVNLDNMLQRFWESETLETDNKNTLTPLEVRAEEIYVKTLARDHDGRFIVGLPFSSDTPILPEQSREIAMKRLHHLERKLAKNTKLKEDYDNVIKEYLTLKHMEPADKPRFDDESSAIEAHEQLQQVMSKCGFDLQKWSSNSPEFMNALQPEKREKSPTLDMNRKNCIKTLGIIWETDKDNLKVTQKQIDHKSIEPVTKRTILSQIASLFDPLGWLAPAIIIAKMFMQKLWLAKLNWDEDLPEDLRLEWTRYQEDLSVLSDIEIERWTGCSQNTNIELHGDTSYVY
ncbi:uncharacterized protein [Choristoneura fumiferana]|uniref:uncharacterized protein n=1 Tax=Choristoneura fumiferana TaxID=7141 RepID=UPI003D15587C